MVASFWSTDDDSDFRREMGLSLLASVLDLILTESIREQLGASYGVAVSSNMSDVYRHFGTVSVSTVIAPDKADEVEAAIAAGARQLREAPVSADLLARARNPMIEQLARSQRENGFWISVVDEAQSRADRLERVRQAKAVLESITAEELQGLARTYLSEAQTQKVRIVSRSAVAKPAAAAR